LADISLVVFDLGGVLLRLRDPIANFGIAGAQGEFLERWLMSPSVRDFERGAIDAGVFAERVVAELGLPFTCEAFLERFDAWPEALHPDTPALLDSIPEGVRSALLSNTNAAHWGRSDIAGVLSGRFDWEFLSFRTGLLKPDAEAYRHVIDTCGVNPEEVLFFDDNPRNVQAASRIGISAHSCTCPAEAGAVINRLIA
jgi:glucose-1-phosphatase